MDLKEVLAHSLVFLTTGFLEQPFSTLLLQSGLRVVSITLSNAYAARVLT